jgi:hypothetical protein
MVEAVYCWMFLGGIGQNLGWIALMESEPLFVF